jgi:hypothetical protein
MTSNNIRNLKDTLKSVISAFEAQEKFLIGPLAVRLEKAAVENPGDQTINLVASFLQKKSSNKDTFITRSELQDVYNKLYVTNSRCSDYLEKELGKRSSLLPEPKKMTRDAEEGKLVENLYAKSDQSLVNALNSAFDNKVEFKPYSNDLALKAQANCQRELNSFSFSPTKIEIVAGNEDCLLCKASYETPKGVVGLLIPVEISGGKTLLPSAFISQAGFENLNEKNVKSFITSTAGKQFKANISAIFNVIKTAKHGISTNDELNEVEQIVLRASLKKETPANYDSNAVMFEIDSKNSTVEMKANAEDVESFSKKLASNKGLAEVGFGKKAIDAGRSLINLAMNSFGFKNTQISIADVDASGVSYAVGVSGGSGFRVPVKFANGLPVTPNVAVAGGKVEAFDEVGVRNLLNVCDYKTAAISSQLYGEKPSELIEVIKTAMAEENLIKAEDALNVLANSGDKVAFNYGFEIFHNALAGKKEEKIQSKCAMPVKNASSKHVLCGHTNLPLHKVYQDEQGNCCPLYRKHIDHSNEGGSFLHSKIYFG